MKSVEEILKKHPEWPAVSTIFHTLHPKGHLAYLAGGCVRDALLGISANDLDIATNATPEQIEKYFPKVVNVGKSFGVMRVLVDGQDIEVATFRLDGKYEDGRRPNGIQFSTPEEDAQRRDFTINALFYDLQTQKVLDFVGGLADLDKKILKTVGEAERRFAEDHLRLLRGPRFVAQLGFDLEESTFLAIQKDPTLIKSVSGERVRDEISKLLGSQFANRGLEIMDTSGLTQSLFPARKPDVFPQGRSKESWQNLALYFRKLSHDEFKKIFQQLRLSVKEQRAMDDFWKMWHAPEAFFVKRLGESLQLYQNEGVQWALQNIVLDQPAFAEKAQNFIKVAQAQGPLPEAFLSGHDLQGKFTGRAMGRCLTEAYCVQLEQKWTDKKQALTWLEEQVQKGSF
jgi:tRNA nucleotidyltransferase/poly(A) polymerase